MSKHSLTRKVGHGSLRHDLVGELRISLWTSSSDTRLNASKAGGSEEGFWCKDGSGLLKENFSRIFFILSIKNEANRSASGLPDRLEGSLTSGTLLSIL